MFLTWCVSDIETCLIYRVFELSDSELEVLNSNSKDGEKTSLTTNLCLINFSMIMFLGCQIFKLFHVLVLSCKRVFFFFFQLFFNFLICSCALVKGFHPSSLCFDNNIIDGWHWAFSYFAVIKKQLLLAVKLWCLGRCGLKSKPKWISSNGLDLICQLRFSPIWMTLVTSFVCLLFLDLGTDLVIHLIPIICFASSL